MDQYVHIRDWMSMSSEDLKEGKVTGRTLCGENDETHSKLTFAVPEVVSEMQVKSYCQKCRKAWLDQYSGSDNKNRRRRFRDVIAGIYTGRRTKMQGATNKRLIVPR